MTQQPDNKETGLRSVQGEHLGHEEDPYTRNDYQRIADAMMAASERARRDAPRWQRILLWVLENNTCRLIITLAAGVLIFSPAYYFGLWWGVLVVVAGFFFAIGWNAARRRAERDGYVDKL